MRDTYCHKMAREELRDTPLSDTTVLQGFHHSSNALLSMDLSLLLLTIRHLAFHTFVWYRSLVMAIIYI